MTCSCCAKCSLSGGQENGDESFTAKIRLGGNPGGVHLHVRDEGGPNGSCLLQADCLDIVLEAGPPSCIMFDTPNVLNCGTHSALGELRVKATDDYGNKASASFEVRPLPALTHHPLQRGCNYPFLSLNSMTRHTILEICKLFWHSCQQAISVETIVSQ